MNEYNEICRESVNYFLFLPSNFEVAPETKILKEFLPNDSLHSFSCWVNKAQNHDKWLESCPWKVEHQIQSCRHHVAQRFSLKRLCFPELQNNCWNKWQLWRCLVLLPLNIIMLFQIISRRSRNSDLPFVFRIRVSKSSMSNFNSFPIWFPVFCVGYFEITLALAFIVRQKIII